MRLTRRGRTVAALMLLSSAVGISQAVAKDGYYEGQGYVRVHDMVGQGIEEQNDTVVYGPFYVHLHEFTPGQQVRVKVENRGFHPTDPYGKVAGPFNVTIDEQGYGRTEFLSLPPQEYKVKIQLGYGSDAEVKEYYNFQVAENSGSVPGPTPSPSPAPVPPAGLPQGGTTKQLTPGGSILVRCN